MKNRIIRVVLSAVLMGNIAIVSYNLATPRPAVERKVLIAPLWGPIVIIMSWFVSGGGSDGGSSGKSAMPAPPPVN